MLTNANATVFEKDTYVKHELHKVYWNDSRSSVTTKNGVQINDSVIVYIYENDYIPKADDIIIEGLTSFEFDTSSQKTISDDMKRFRGNFPQFAVIKNVKNCQYGGLPHIEIIAR
jgi:hypothetical protein